MKTPLYCQPPFFNFFPNPSRLQSSPPLLFLFLWLNGWLRHTWCVILLNNIMDLHRSSLGIIVPVEPCFVFCAKGVKFTEVRHIMSFLASTLIWNHTPDTNKDTQQTQGIMPLLFYSLVEVIYLLVRFNNTKFFPWNTNNDRTGVDKQNTHRVS